MTIFPDELARPEGKLTLAEVPICKAFCQVIHPMPPEIPLFNHATNLWTMCRSGSFSVSTVSRLVYYDLAARP